PRGADPLPVVALDYQRELTVEPADLGPCTHQSELRRQLKAEVLILGVPIEFACRRLQDVRRRYAPGRDPPPISLQVQCGLGLGPRQAELPCISFPAPPTRIQPNLSQALRDFRGGQPLHGWS